KDQVRAFPLRCDRSHRRVNAEFPGLTACRGDNTALLRTTDGDRSAAQVWIVPLFDRRVDGVMSTWMILRGGGASSISPMRPPSATSHACEPRRQCEPGGHLGGRFARQPRQAKRNTRRVLADWPG